MPYDIPRPTGYRIQPLKLQDDEALVASLAQQLLKARLAEARAAARGGGGGGGSGKSGGKGKGAWVRKFDPKTGRYERVWVEGSTGKERGENAKGEDFNKTADWLDSNPEAQRLLGVLRNGKASNAARQKALSELRSLKGAGDLEGLNASAVDEAVERAAKPYKEQVEAEKKEIAGAGKGLLSNIQIGLDRLGTFVDTIGDDAETTLAKRRKSLERQQAIREADPYLREQSRREAEGESMWDRSEGASGVAANMAGALLGDPSALPVAGGALAGGLVGGPVGMAIGAGLAAAGGAASGDTYLGERLAQDERLSEAEKAQAYEEGKSMEMGVNAAVNAIPFGGAKVTSLGRTALAAAGKGALGREALASAEAFARNPAWRTAAGTAGYAERFGGLAGEAAEQAVAKAAMRPIAADLVRNSERGIMGALKYEAVPEAAFASGLNAGAMLGSNIHYNELTGQNDSIAQNVPEAAAMGLLFGIPAGIGGAVRNRRMASALTSPETRLAADQINLDKKPAVSAEAEGGASSAKPSAEAAKETGADLQSAAARSTERPADLPPQEEASSMQYQTEVTSGEGRVQGAGESAPVPGAGRQGEAGAGAEDSGAGGAVGADTPDAARADAGGVPAEAGVRNPQDQGGGTGGRPGGSPAPAQDTAGGARAEGTGHESGGEGAVGKSGSGTTAEVRPDADQVARGTEPPAEPGAGSAPAGGSPAAPVAPKPKRGRAKAAAKPETVPGDVVRDASAPRSSEEGWDRQLSAWDKIKSDKSQAAIKTARRHLAAAGGKDGVEGVRPVADTLSASYGLNAQGVADLIERAVRGEEDFTPQMRRGLERLADFYNHASPSGARAVPVVHRVYSSDAKRFPPGSPGRQIFDFLDGPLLGQLDRSDPKNPMSEMLRSVTGSRLGSQEWSESVANLLTRVKQLVSDDPDAQKFFNAVFKKQFNSGKPISGADVAFAVDPKGAAEKTAKANRRGTKQC